jgi:hypothetical protein
VAPFGPVAPLSCFSIVSNFALIAGIVVINICLLIIFSSKLDQ